MARAILSTQIPPEGRILTPTEIKKVKPAMPTSRVACLSVRRVNPDSGYKGYLYYVSKYGDEEILPKILVEVAIGLR